MRMHLFFWLLFQVWYAQGPNLLSVYRINFLKNVANEDGHIAVKRIIVKMKQIERFTSDIDSWKDEVDKTEGNLFYNKARNDINNFLSIYDDLMYNERVFSESEVQFVQEKLNLAIRATNDFFRFFDKQQRKRPIIGYEFSLKKYLIELNEICYIKITANDIWEWEREKFIFKIK